MPDPDPQQPNLLQHLPDPDPQQPNPLQYLPESSMQPVELSRPGHSLSTCVPSNFEAVCPVRPKIRALRGVSKVDRPIAPEAPEEVTLAQAVVCEQGCNEKEGDEEPAFRPAMFQEDVTDEGRELPVVRRLEACDDGGGKRWFDNLPKDTPDVWDAGEQEDEQGVEELIRELDSARVSLLSVVRKKTP